jgi:hypothetical protein
LLLPLLKKILDFYPFSDIRVPLTGVGENQSFLEVLKYRARLVARRASHMPRLLEFPGRKIMSLSSMA